jgi:hypothetical protein
MVLGKQWLVFIMFYIATDTKTRNGCILISLLTACGHIPIILELCNPCWIMWIGELHYLQWNGEIIVGTRDHTADDRWPNPDFCCDYCEVLDQTACPACPQAFGNPRSVRCTIAASCSGNHAHYSSCFCLCGLSWVRRPQSTHAIWVENWTMGMMTWKVIPKSYSLIICSR